MTVSPPPPHSTADAASIWNQRFAIPDYLFGTHPNAWLREHGGHWRPGDRVLCVADGEGRNSVWLAEQGLRVEAFDIAEIGVAKAQKLAQSRGVSVHYTVSDCDTYDWPHAAYDGVVAIFVQFADPPMRERLFARMRDCLKPGGILVLQGYSPQQLDYKTGGPSEISHLYTESLLRQAFAGWELMALRDYEAELDEGARHRGRSALLGLVARRAAAGG